MNQYGATGCGAGGPDLTDWSSRAIGTVVGSAVGDALGAPFEFQLGGAFRARFKNGTGEMCGGGGWDPGEATDDTQMAVLVAESLLERGGLDLPDVFARFQRWAASEPKDIGLQTEDVLTNGEPWDLAAALHFQVNIYAAGNGSLMRAATSAVAFAPSGRATTMAAARRLAALTHGDRAAWEGTAILHELIRAALTSNPDDTPLHPGPSLPLPRPARAADPPSPSHPRRPPRPTQPPPTDPITQPARAAGPPPGGGTGGQGGGPPRSRTHPAPAHPDDVPPAPRPRTATILAAVPRALAEVHPDHRDRWATVLAPDWHPDDATEFNGAVWPCLGSALWALRTTASFEDSLAAAIDLGGDTDTVAAVTGALAGAAYGAQAIPTRWTDPLHVPLPGFAHRVLHFEDLRALALNLSRLMAPPADTPRPPRLRTLDPP